MFLRSPLTAGSEIKSKKKISTRLKEADEALRWQLLFLNFATLFRKMYGAFSVFCLVI